VLPASNLLPPPPLLLLLWACLCQPVNCCAGFDTHAALEHLQYTFTLGPSCVDCLKPRDLGRPLLQHLLA
jgi:hypothetical protein